MVKIIIDKMKCYQFMSFIFSVSERIFWLEIFEKINFHKIIIRDCKKFMIINHQRFSFCIISKMVLTAPGLFNEEICEILSKFNSLKWMGCVNSPFKHIFFRMKLRSENGIVTGFYRSYISRFYSSSVSSS